MAPPTDPGKKDEALEDPEHPDDEIEVEADPGKEPEAEEEEDSGKAVEAALAELKGITDRHERAEKARQAEAVRARQEKAAEAAKPVEIPDDIKELLASDDPAEVREGRTEKRRWEHEQKVDQRLAAMEQRVEETALAATRQEVEPEIRAGVTKYGLNSEEESEVIDYLTDSRYPQRLELPFEDGIRARFPGKTVASRASAPDNGTPSTPRRQPGQVIAGTGTGGRAPQQWKPEKDTSTDDAVAAWANQKFGRR